MLPSRDRMAGRYARSWCPACHAPAGLDCPDSSRSVRDQRKAAKSALRRYLRDELEDEMDDPTPGLLHMRKRALDEGYDAVIRPWIHGWEIFRINGPGIMNGATQACTIDEVGHMILDYVDCTLGLTDDGDWDMSDIPIRLTLELEHDRYTDTRTTSVEAMLGGETVELVEQITWWREAPDAE